MEVCSAALRPTRMVPLTARPISVSLQVRPTLTERCDQRVVPRQHQGKGYTAEFSKLSIA